MKKIAGRMNLLFIAVCTGMIVIYVSNIWRSDLLPFTDLPNHLAEAYLQRVLPNPDEPLREYYGLQVSALTPATIHIYFCARFADVEVGNKIFYTLYLLIFPISLLLLVLLAGGNRWIALLALLFVFNYSTTEGFAAFTIGIALTLLDMVVLVKFMAKPSVAWAVALTASTLTLFYAHVVVLLFACAVTTLALLSRRGMSAREKLLGLAALVPAGVLAIAWFFQFQAAGGEQSIPSFLISYYRHDYFSSWPSRLIGMLYDNKQIAPKPLGHLLSLLFVAPLLVGFTAFSTRHKFKNLLTLDNSSKHVGVIFVTAAGLCYLILPDHLPGWWYFYQRFSVFILVGLIWITSWLIPARFLKPAQTIAVLIVLIHAGLWFQYFSAFDQVAKPFRTLLYDSSLAKDRTLAAIIDDYNFRGSPVFIHYQNYQLIWNHGAVPTTITDYRFRLIQRQSGALPLYQEWVTKEDYATLLDRYSREDLLISHGSDALAYILQDGRYTLVDRREDWALLETRTK